MIHRLVRLDDNYYMRSVILFLISIFVLLICLDRPAQLIFDEKFYVPAALGILSHQQDQNYQHPPFAKEFMALSIEVFGDSPWGWRLASVVMGALALVAIYQLASFAMGSYYALMAVLLVFANGLFFTLSRLAMLEIFAMSLSLLGISEWLRRTKGFGHKSPRVLIVPGAFFGLALAAKWSSIIPLILCFAGGIYLHQFRLKHYLVFLSSVLGFYFLPFLILTGSKVSVFELHQAMWRFHYPEIYASGLMENTSQWWQWAFNYEPMWFAVLPNAQQDHGQFLGVMIFGNPFVIWVGWLGLLVCVWAWFKGKLQLNGLVQWLPMLALAPWLVWAVAQRPVTYYYYFLPTSVFLAIALVAAVYWLAQEKILSIKKAQIFLGLWAFLSLTYFFYHWPLMTGAEMSAAEFSQWYPHYIWR